MKEQCCDENAIQAFLDGELAPAALERVARHVASCDDCARLLQEAEAESAFAFAALDEGFNTLVPTERIRTNLYQAISEIEKPQVSFWSKITSFRLLLASPSLAAFGGLLIVAASAAIIWESGARPATDGAIIAQIEQPKHTPPLKTNDSAARDAVGINQSAVAQSATELNAPPIKRAAARSADFQPKYQSAKYTAAQLAVETPQTGSVGGKSAVASVEILAGEDTYLKTIATLKKTVDNSKDVVLDASSRVAYEKDMALADDAIDKMRREVRKNPKNDAAREVLRNSYQNKIELLNSVAERSELIAGLD